MKSMYQESKRYGPPKWEYAAYLTFLILQLNFLKKLSIFSLPPLPPCLTSKLNFSQYFLFFFLKKNLRENINKRYIIGFFFKNQKKVEFVAKYVYVTEI